MGRDRRALVAAYQYLPTGTVGATLYVLGIGILYLETGTLNLADMAVRLPQLGDPRGTLAALAFITVGLSLKIALFPLHLWLPNAYVFAPSAASAFLAATATKVSIYVLMRYFFTVFGSVVVFDTHLTGAILVALSLGAMFIAAAVAIYQRNVKRLLAYSSLSQIGYITLGISLNTVGGLTAATAHLFNHALTKGGMFLLLGCVVSRCGNSDFSRLAGLGRTMPLDLVRVRHRRPEPDWHPRDRRLHQQVVSGDGGDGGGPLVDGGGDHAQFAARRDLRLAFC